MSSNGGFSIIMVMPTKNIYFTVPVVRLVVLAYEKIFILPVERLVVRAGSSGRRQKLN